MLGQETELDKYDLPMPEAAKHVWGWYHDLSRGRQNGMSINPISWEALDSWANRRKINPQQWEIDAIFGIDAAQVASILEDQEKPKTPTR